MRKVLVPILVAIFGWLLLQSVPHVLAQSTYPSDLTILAVSGGLAPWERLEKIEINSTGYSTYWLMTNRTTAEWVLNSTFILSEDNLTTIWNAIQTNNFFSLAPNYTDPEWMDGSFCLMDITANGQTHRVATQNIKVLQFDAIAITINSVTPGDLDLFYNEIHPDIDPPVMSTIIKTPDKFSPTFLNLAVFSFGTLISGTAFLCLRGTHRRLKRWHIGLSRSLRFFILVFVLALLIVTPVMAEDNTKVTSEACHVKVEIWLEFYGPGVTPALVKRFEEGIEKTWSCDGTYKWCGMCTVTFDAHTKIRKETGQKTPGYHQIKVVNGPYPHTSRVYGLMKFDPKTGKTGTGTGEWDDQDTEEVAAHEAGHLYGRDDTYISVCGCKPPVHTSKNIINCPNRGSILKDAKYKDDLMATTRAGVHPYPEHIDGIIRDSWQIPPPFAEAIPKTITIRIPIGYGEDKHEVRNTGHFDIKISNPTDNVISVSMEFAWTGAQPEDTIVGVLTGYIDVNPHNTRMVGLPAFSVGPKAKPGIYPCRIRWTVAQTGFKFDTDPYVELTPPVGGLSIPIAIPAEKLILLAPYFGLASTIIVATVVTAIYAKRVNRKKEKQ